MNGMPQLNPLRTVLEAKSYGEARLRLGLVGVGTFVILSLFGLLVGLPGAVFGVRGGSLLTDASLIAVWLTASALLAAPFEFVGGHVLPTRHGRPEASRDEWLVGWIRGVVVLVVVMSFSGAMILAAARFGGVVGGVGMLGLVVVAIASMQRHLGALVGGYRARDAGLEAVRDELARLGVDPPRIAVVDATEPAFTGGISGPPTGETIVVPYAWLGRFEPRAVAALIARRTTIIDRGHRALGLAGAIGFTLVAFTLSTLLPGGGLESVAGLVRTSLWFTLFSFVGLLLLPTPSRAATLAADAAAVEEREELLPILRETLGSLDELQDEARDRTERSERYLQPIPAIDGRLAALGDSRTETAPWHLARTTLVLSIAALNPLHRLVHCNVGRPELWVDPPADG